MAQDLYDAPDYFLLDELLTEEHLLIRDAAREWVKREISPIIEDALSTIIVADSIMSGPIPSPGIVEIEKILSLIIVVLLMV